MSMRARRWTAACTVLCMVGCIAPTVALPLAHGEMLGLFGPDLGAAVTFSLVGAFLLVRGAVTNLAVIMCVQGVGSSVTSLTIVLYNLAAKSGPLHGAGLWVAWLNSIVWVPGIVLLTSLIVLFPNGTLAGRGWRWLIVAAIGFGTLFEIVALFGRHSVVAGKSYNFAPNPTGVVDLGPASGADTVAFIGMLVCFAISLGSLVVRRRSAAGVERAQYTSLLFGASISVGVLVLVAVQANVLDANPVLFVVELFAILPIAFSFAVAVLRYRLFEIDKVVSRTVTHALVLVVLAGVYVGVVTALAQLVPSRYGPVGVAVATLLVSMLAVPLTRRVRHVVDRRFDRSRFDAERVATAFAARLRARPERGDVPADLLEVVQRTVAPTHAGVWLVDGG